MAQLATIPRYICRETILTNLIYNTIFMKQNTMTEVKGYEAPNFDVVLAAVERGFEASLPGVSINPWESDGDSLEF